MLSTILSTLWVVWWGIIKALLMLWPIWLLFVLLFIARYGLPILIERWKNKRKFLAGQQWRSDRDLIHWLRAMKPAEFEQYIAGLFSKLGYKTEVTGGAYDQGVDVIAEKNGIKYYIQCKKFITSVVGPSAVRDFYGAIADHLVNGKAYFITTNKFTLEAERFAEDKPIELIDSFGLIKYIHLAEEQNKLAAPTPSAEITEKCPQCGGNLVARSGQYGKFYGCSNFPKCRFTKKI